MSILRKILPWIFFSSGLILIGLYSFTSLDPVLMPRFTFISALLVLINLTGLFVWKTEDLKAGLDFFKGRYGIYFGLFLITGGIATLFAKHWEESLWFWLKDLMFFSFLFVVVINIRKNRLTLALFVKSASLMIIVASSIAFYQLFAIAGNGINTESIYEISSTLAHRNLYSSFLILLFPLAILSFVNASLLWKVMGGLASFQALFWIIFLQSRATWLALGVGLFFFSVFKWLKPYRWSSFLKLKKTGFIVFSLALIIGFFTFYFSAPKNLKAQELAFNIRSDDPSNKTFTIQERILLWKGTGKMIQDNPLWGIGPNQWKMEFPKYGSDIWRARQGLVQFQRPHNDFLWILSEQGIGGLVAYIFMFFSVFVLGFRFLKKNNQSKFDRAIILLILSGLAAYLTVSFFSFPRERIMHQWALALYFGVVIAICWPNETIKSNTRKSLNINRSYIILPILFGSIALCSFFVGLNRWKGEILTREVLAAKNESDWSLMQHRAKEADLLPFYSMDPTSVPISFYEGLAYLNMEENKEAQSSFLKAYQIHPNNIHVVNNVANIYQINGDLNSAIKYYEQALTIAPKYLDGILNLASAYFNNHQIITAHEILIKHKTAFPKNHQTYEGYVITILSVIKQNLRDEINDPIMKQGLVDLNDEWMLQIHEKVAQDSMAVQLRILEDAIFGLESLSGTISSKQAEDYRNLYLSRFRSY